MRKRQCALPRELLFIDNYSKEKPQAKSRKERLTFTSLESEMTYTDICWEPKWWSSPGRVSCPLSSQLSQTTQLFLSASEEQHGREPREEEPLGRGLQPCSHELLIACKPLEWSPSSSHPGRTEGQSSPWPQITGDPGVLPVRELFLPAGLSLAMCPPAETPV